MRALLDIYRLRHGVKISSLRLFFYMLFGYAAYVFSAENFNFLPVPLIINAFVHLVARDAANFWWGLIFALIGSVIFLMICLKKDHKPDLGFPKTGKISLNGMLHLPYFGIGIGASIICLWNLFTGYLYGPVMLIAFMGGVFYLICYVAEIKSGNFALLKKIKV